MLIAQLSEVSKAFGSNEILDRISWQIADGARVALVGRNGSGKTTLFRLLNGELEPDRGTVWRRRGAVVASMEQELRVEDGRTLREEAARGLEHLHDLHRAMPSPPGWELREDSLRTTSGGYGTRMFEGRLYLRVSGLRLDGLHFSERDLDRPRRVQRRTEEPGLFACFARSHLLSTSHNHRSERSNGWEFLTNYRGAFVLVSHDRMFVNRLAEEAAEIRRRHLHMFRGNYDAFLSAREQRQDQAWKYERSGGNWRQKDFIRRNSLAETGRPFPGAKLERMELLNSGMPASSIACCLRRRTAACSWK
jgi:energy-coupling factor transporter ATP-binding protein EcfA2